MYNTISFRLYEENFYCLWFTDESDKDQFLTSYEGVVSFLNCRELSKFVSEKKLNVAPDKTFYDVNVAINWIAENDSNVDCEYFLALWNITTDLAYSVSVDFLGDSASELTRQIYDKLFWGNNLPAIRCDGEIFTPQWSPEEIHEIQMIVSDSIDIIKSIFLAVDFKNPIPGKAEA